MSSGITEHNHLKSSRNSSPGPESSSFLDNKKDIFSPKAAMDRIGERHYEKFDHDALLAEYDDNYQKDAAFERGQT